ncbi:2-keto-4-pentenoate hydratase [Planococcus salinus]|uniref:2-keto-4-pentenoate hydratase n=1 Tax=Planococcus salinus TaxID=1848460 RepID=A0A3M8P622_9BACL|nr:hypothetical protein [Planococcus salinus]RNF39146.1 hypothetical protein EEX84_10615 [Planococcus salinus]
MEQFDLNDKELALLLYEAHLNNQPIGKDKIPAFLEKDKAYAVQRAVTEKKTADSGEEVAAYKISLTSKETQDLFASDTPLYGAMTASALSDGTIQLSSMLSPLIEIELVFIAKEDLSIEDDIDAIIEKTMVAPGIEVPDSRFEDWFPNITLSQVIADSAVAGKIVVGEAIDDYSYNQLDGINGSLTLDGEEIANGPSSDVLGHPVNAVKWLINELDAHGLSLKKGMHVSSGTFILPKQLEKGQYEASYDGLGSVKLEVK